MIKICNSCGNYTVKRGEEVAGARNLIAKLREQARDPWQAEPLSRQFQYINQLRLELDLLLSELQPVRRLIEQDNRQADRAAV